MNLFVGSVFFLFMNYKTCISIPFVDVKVRTIKYHIYTVHICNKILLVMEVCWSKSTYASVQCFINQWRNLRKHDTEGRTWIIPEKLIDGQDTDCRKTYNRNRKISNEIVSISRWKQEQVIAVTGDGMQGR